jgi:hypothetical protein
MKEEKSCRNRNWNFKKKRRILTKKENKFSGYSRYSFWSAWTGWRQIFYKRRGTTTEDKNAKNEDEKSASDINKVDLSSNSPHRRWPFKRDPFSSGHRFFLRRLHTSANRDADGERAIRERIDAYREYIVARVNWMKNLSQRDEGELVTNGTQYPRNPLVDG